SNCDTREGRRSSPGLEFRLLGLLRLGGRSATPPRPFFGNDGRNLHGGSARRGPPGRGRGRGARRRGARGRRPHRRTRAQRARAASSRKSAARSCASSFASEESRRVWRGGRAAEGARLESVYTETYRGFESHPLRQRRVRRSAPECRFAPAVLLLRYEASVLESWPSG